METTVPFRVELVFKIAGTLLLGHTLQVLDLGSLEKQVEDGTTWKDQRILLQILIFYEEIRLRASFQDFIELLAV